MSNRKNFAQGRFYPGNSKEIERIFKEALEGEEVDYTYASKEIIGGVVPHAGYIYCARVGIHLFELIRSSKEKYDTVILLNPNHTGYGYSLEIDINDFWETPFGKVEIDSELREKLDLDKGVLSQKFEHSGEVMLPYLKYFIEEDFKLLPICMLDQRYVIAEELAEKIHRAVKETGKKVLIIASSDFTHFKTREEGRVLDSYALEALEKLDSKEFYSRVTKKGISICGHGPIMVLMEYMKLTGRNPKMKVLARGDSGEISGSDEVVDYVSLIGIDE